MPRYGVDFEDNQVRWSYDWRAPYDTNTLTGEVKFPYPYLDPVLPSDLVVVENDAYHHCGVAASTSSPSCSAPPGPS